MNFHILSDNTKPNVFNSTSSDITLSEDGNLNLPQQTPVRTPIYSYRSNCSEFTQLEQIDELDTEHNRISSRKVTEADKLCSQQIFKENPVEKFSECIRSQSTINNLFKQVEVLQKEAILREKMSVKQNQIMSIKQKEEIYLERNKQQILMDEVTQLQLMCETLQLENSKLKQTTIEFQDINLDLRTTIDLVQDQMNNIKNESLRQINELVHSREQIQKQLSEQSQLLQEKQNEVIEFRKEQSTWKLNVVHVQSNSEVQILDLKQKYNLSNQEAEFQQVIFLNLKKEKDQIFIKLQETLHKYQTSFEETEILKQSNTKLQNELSKLQTKPQKMDHGSTDQKLLTKQSNNMTHTKNKSQDFSSSQRIQPITIRTQRNSPQSNKENDQIFQTKRKLEYDETLIEQENSNQRNNFIHNSNEQILKRCRTIAGLM